MKDQLLVNAVNIIFENVCKLYDDYGEYINVNNVDITTLNRLSISVETAMNIEYNYRLGKVVHESLYTKAKRVHYQSKRELISSRQISFESAFGVSNVETRKIVDHIREIRLKAVLHQENGIYILPAVMIEAITEINPFAAWYIRNAIEEISRKYMCTHITYPPDMPATDQIKDINRRLALKEEEMKQNGFGSMFQHLLSYMGIFDESQVQQHER